MFKLCQLSSLAVLAIAVGSFACTAKAVDPTEKPATQVGELSDGLTILEADPSLGKLVAAFKRDGRAVTFHLRLGPRMESVAAGDLERTDIPTYEIDGIVRDQEGRAMTTQIGGDRFIDPSWVFMDASGAPDLEVRTADFARAVAAKEAFAAWTAPNGLEQLRLGAMQLAHLSQDLDRTTATKLPTEGGPALGTKQEYVNPYGDPYYNYNWTYSIWEKNTAVIAEHSAVRLNLYSSGGTFIRNWETCNHGTCAAADPMSKNCVSAKMADSNDTRYVYAEYSTDWDGKAGCTNGYWPQGDAFGTHHNCHNDTRLQRYAIVTGPVGDASRAGDYGSLCAKEDFYAPSTCPTSF